MLRDYFFLRDVISYLYIYKYTLDTFKRLLLFWSEEGNGRGEGGLFFVEMFVTTVNNCTFKIGFGPSTSSRRDNNSSNNNNNGGGGGGNNLLWGDVVYDDCHTTTIKDHYEQYLWTRLLNDCPDDRFKHKTQYNPYTCAHESSSSSNNRRRSRRTTACRFTDDVNLKLFGTAVGVQQQSSSNGGTSTSSGSSSSSSDPRTVAYFQKLSNHVSERLVRMNHYKKSVYALNVIFNKEEYLFEPFQLSVFYEHLFFYMQQHSPGILRLFIMAMQPYFKFDFISVDHVIRMYTNKHYIDVIPRRHGKTMTIHAVIAACLIGFPGLVVMAVAQSKNIINTTKKKICGYISYWNAYVEPGSIGFSFPSQDNVQIEYRQPVKANNNNGSISGKDVFKVEDSYLVCVSAHNDNSLRGPDPQMCIVDETMCIKPGRFNTILALGQKKMCKVGFLSSPTPTSHPLLIQFTTRLSHSGSGTNFYHINYFCGSPKHAKYSVSQEGCVNMVFYKPRHITFTSANKTLTEIMTASTTCYDGELGILREDEIEEAKQLQHSAAANLFNHHQQVEAGTATKCFTQGFYEFYKSPQFICYTHPHHPIDDAMFIYLDPAFNATIQSGIGLACTGKMTQNTYAIFYMAHRLIKEEDLLIVDQIIYQMILECVATVRHRLGSQKIRFFIAIENNCQMSNVARIYEEIKKQWSYDFPGWLYYTASKIVDDLSRAKNNLLPGYGMTTSKRKIIGEVLYLFNNRQVKLSYTMPCDNKTSTSTIRNGSGLNPLEYFLSECQTFRWVPEKRTYQGKIKRLATDDLMIAVLMSIYFSKSYGTVVDKFVFPNPNQIPQPLPWRPIVSPLDRMRLDRMDAEDATAAAAATTTTTKGILMRRRF